MESIDPLVRSILFQSNVREDEITAIINVTVHFSAVKTNPNQKLDEENIRTESVLLDVVGDADELKTLGFTIGVRKAFKSNVKCRVENCELNWTTDWLDRKNAENQNAERVPFTKKRRAVLPSPPPPLNESPLSDSTLPDWSPLLEDVISVIGLNQQLNCCAELDITGRLRESETNGRGRGFVAAATANFFNTRTTV